MSLDTVNMPIRVLESERRSSTCFRNTRFFIPIFSAQFASISREILLHGGIIVGDSCKADICIAPDDHIVEKEGWYIPKLIKDSIRNGAVPCLCRYDKVKNRLVVP
jgi:hypothetical protein